MRAPPRQKPLESDPPILRFGISIVFASSCFMVLILFASNPWECPCFRVWGWAHGSFFADALHEPQWKMST